MVCCTFPMPFIFLDIVTTHDINTSQKLVKCPSPAIPPMGSHHYVPIHVSLVLISERASSKAMKSSSLNLFPREGGASPFSSAGLPSSPARTTPASKPRTTYTTLPEQACNHGTGYCSGLHSDSSGKQPCSEGEAPHCVWGRRGRGLLKKRTEGLGPPHPNRCDSGLTAPQMLGTGFRPQPPFRRSVTAFATTRGPPDSQGCCWGSPKAKIPTQTPRPPFLQKNASEQGVPG